MDELTREFLIESGEGLDRMERRLAEMRGGSATRECVADIFRAVHTIKGTVGFLGFSRLELLAHAGEQVLAMLRDGKREADEAVVAALVRLMDRVRVVLQLIESTGAEGSRSGDEDRELIDTLNALAGAEPVQAAPEGEQVSALGAGGATAAGGAAESTLRVDVETLNRLMNLVGELVQTRNQILQAGQSADSFARLGQKLDSVTVDLRETVMKARLQPVEQLFQKFPRLVREVAQICGKCVRLESSGGETGLDKSLLETLKDPLTHAVRNAIDHGIEAPHERVLRGKGPEGVVHLRAFHESGHVVVEVSDDGAGISSDAVLRRAVERGLLSAERALTISHKEAIQLVFEPGFSTRDDVTMISGRGVGMDVVRANVERAGGSVELQSRDGEGTTLRMRVPLTLAIVPGLIARCGEQTFAVPRSAVLEMVVVHRRDEAKMIQRIGNAKMFLLRNRLIPLVSLSDVLGLQGHVENGYYVAVLEARGRKFGLIVDDMADPQEIVVKPLAQALRRLKVYAGATVLGDGQIALILDAAGVASVAGVSETIDSGCANSQQSDAELAQAVEAQTPALSETMLVFEDFKGERCAVPLRLVERIESITREAVELPGGEPVLQYRGELLPLRDPGGLLREWSGAAAERIVLICQAENGASRAGVVVREVLDVAQGEMLPGSAMEGKGVARIGGKLASLQVDFAKHSGTRNGLAAMSWKEAA